MTGACKGIIISGTLIPLPLLLAGAALLGAIIPLIFNRLVLSRKDRNENDQKRFENSKDLLADGIAKANDFQAAIGRAIKKAKPGVDDVLAIMKTGEVYFATLRVMAQAVLDERVSDNTRTHDIVPKISEALEKSIPAYYHALSVTCKKVGMKFDGEFKEENYESLFLVVDKYDHSAWRRVRQRLGESA